MKIITGILLLLFALLAGLAYATTADADHQDSQHDESTSGSTVNDNSSNEETQDYSEQTNSESNKNDGSVADQVENSVNEFSEEMSDYVSDGVQYQIRYTEKDAENDPDKIQRIYELRIAVPVDREQNGTQNQMSEHQMRPFPSLEPLREQHTEDFSGDYYPWMFPRPRIPQSFDEYLDQAHQRKYAHNNGRLQVFGLDEAHGELYVDYDAEGTGQGFLSVQTLNGGNASARLVIRPQEKQEPAESDAGDKNKSPAAEEGISTHI